MACIDAPSAHASLLTKGDFSSGLTGWIPYTTSDGTIGSPAVVNFDVTGLGSNPGAQLQVGEVNFTNVQRGGGLCQTFVDPAGDYSLSYDFASENLGSANSSGTFTPVLGPLPLLGVGAAFGLSRKLRKRSKAGGTPVSSTHTL